MVEPLAELVQRARAGAAEARTELYERFADHVLRRIRYGARRRNWFWLDDEDDIVQEVFARFFAALDRGQYAHRDEDGLLGYLTRTCFFAIMDLKNKLRQQEKLGWDAAALESLDMRAFGRSLPDELAVKECLSRLYAEIEDLPEARARVLKGWLFGQSIADLAGQMGRSANAVSGLKFQALKQLRERFEATSFLADCGAFFGLEVR